MDDLRTLVSALLSGDDQKAEAAAIQFASCGSAAFPALQAQFTYADPDSRWWVVRALAEIDDPRIPPLLLSALHDPDQAVCQCAALALRQQPSPQAIPALVNCLPSTDRLLARLASDALVAIGPDSVPALLDTMQNGPSQARPEAVRALALIADPHAIPQLFQSLDDDSALVSHWADEGLTRMGVGMVFFKPGG
jgi:HEAT repeat protein